MSALPHPYPTKTRLRLAEAINAGHVRHFHFIKPETRDTATDRVVTERVRQLVDAELATLGGPQYPGGNSRVALTPAGSRWYAAGSRKLNAQAGPGSTSPEPEPCRLADWCVVTGPHDAWGCSLSTSPEPGLTCTNCAGTGMDSTDHGFKGQPAEVHACGYCHGTGGPTTKDGA